jgi:hypothetical protein
MKEEETLKAFAVRCRITVSNAFSDTTNSEKLTVDYFLCELPIEIRNSVRIQRPKAMNEAEDQGRFQSNLMSKGKPKKRKSEAFTLIDHDSEEPDSKQPFSSIN